MKRYFTSYVFVFVVIVCTLPQNTFADDPRARAIMEKVDARDDGDNQTSDMEMILIDVMLEVYLTLCIILGSMLLDCIIRHMR